jgi:competence protein ComEC
VVAAVVAVGLAVRAPIAGLVAAVLLTGGVLAGQARLAAIEGDRGPAAGRVDARAVLLERPRPTRFGSYAVVRLASGARRGERLLARAGARTRWPVAADPGAVVVLGGRLAPPKAGRDATFDFPAHLRRRGVFAELRVDRLRATGEQRGGPAGALDAVRRRAERAIRADLPAREAVLVRGMVLGQDEAITATLRDDFRRSGLGHLLAVYQTDRTSRK